MGIRGHLGTPKGVGAVRGCQGVLGAGRGCRYSGARRAAGAQGGIGASRGRGVGSHKGASGVLGWQVDWEPNHIGPHSRVPALPLVPLGE